VASGDPVERIKEDEDRISVLELNRAYTGARDHLLVVQRALRHEGLPAGLREHFLEQLALIEES